MEFKVLTKNVKISVLGLGTWGMGGGMTPSHTRDKEEIEAIQYAIEKGLTHIDTAELYGAGHAEELVGEAIKSFDRKKLFIATKISPQHLFLKSQILKSAKKSLKRLKTDYIDLYLIHWPAPFAPMKKVMETFDELVKEGLVRYCGVSNFSVRQLVDAQKYTKNKIVTNQVHYSLLNREPEKALLSFCQKEGIILTAYSPLEQGRLIYNRFAALEKIAKKYNKTPAQVALRWLIEKPQVITIPKSSLRQHIDEITGSLGWKLKEEDQIYLNQEF